MPLPLLPVAAIIGQSIVHVLAKPWPWLFLFGWLVVAKFDFGVFAEEVRETIWSLWWVVILLFVFLIARDVIKRKMKPR